MCFQLEWSETGDFQKSHNRIDHCFGFDVTEKEAIVPQARFCLHAQDVKEQMSYIRLSYQDTVIFQGRIVRIQTQKNALFVDVEAVAYDDSVHHKIGAIRRQLIDEGVYDPLLCKHEDDGHPALKDLLSFQVNLPYIARDMSTVSLSPVWGEGAVINLSNDIYADSFDKKERDPFSSEGSVSVTASWTESYYGTTDVSEALCEHLPNQCIETFTGKAFEDKWWKAESAYGLHGYRIESSGLEYRGPGRSVCLGGVYDQACEGEDEAQKVYTARFKPQLSLTWRFRQPRKEVVYFGDPLARAHTKLTVKGLQKVFHKRRWSYDLYFKKGEYVVAEDVVYRCTMSHRSGRQFEGDQEMWKAICPEKDFDAGYTGASFFQSERGQALLQKVALTARMKQIASGYHSDISFVCSGYEGQALHVNQRVCLTYPGHHQQPIQGKITEHKLIADGTTGCYRSLLTVVQRQMPPDADAETEEKRPSIHLVALDQDSDQSETPKLFTSRELLKDVTIFQGADEQEAYLEAQEEVTDIPGTRLQLKLEDLSEKETMIKRYQGRLQPC